MKRFDLLSVPGLRAILVSRRPQFIVQLAAVAGLSLVVVTGLLGTPVGSRNPATVLVWIAWWAALMIVAVPLFGRLWCSICPLPLPGEWLQRGAMLRSGGTGRGRSLRWPRRLRGMWVQTAAFILVAIFSLPVLTQPRLTAILLVGLALLAIAISLVFERRSFCRYLCPVGGFIGLYSQAAPLELRVRDVRVCADHTTKTCYAGSAAGYGCPWMTFPAALKTNVSCGLCLECLRTCPLDNIAINLRPMGSDLGSPQRVGLDEAFKSLLLVGSALVYVFVLQGPSSNLRAAAADVGSVAWLAYVTGFLLITLVVLPALLLLATRAGRPVGSSRLDRWSGFRAFAPALVPLGLGAWAAFSLGFVLTNGAYILPAISDPLGLGWNLLGASGAAWRPAGGSLGAWPLVAILLAGLAWTSRRVRAVAEDLGGGLRMAIPVWGFALLLTSGILWVFVA